MRLLLSDDMERVFPSRRIFVTSSLKLRLIFVRSLNSFYCTYPISRNSIYQGHPLKKSSGIDSFTYKHSKTSFEKTVFLRGRVRWIWVWSTRLIWYVYRLWDMVFNTISHRRQTYHINLVDQTHILYIYPILKCSVRDPFESNIFLFTF